MKNKISILVLAVVIASCSGSDEVKDPCHMGPLYMDIKITNAKGEDLLNQSNKCCYKESDICFYKDSELTINYLDTNGEQILRSDENQNYFITLPIPIDYRIEKNGKTTYCSTSYLKLNDTIIDTICTECISTDCGKILTKLEYNGEDITSTMIVIKE